jgi:hypothetical protein
MLWHAFQLLGLWFFPLVFFLLGGLRCIFLYIGNVLSQKEAPYCFVINSVGGFYISHRESVRVRVNPAVWKIKYYWTTAARRN